MGTWCETLRQYAAGEIQLPTARLVVVAWLAAEVDELNRPRQEWYEALGDFKKAVEGRHELTEESRGMLSEWAFKLGAACDFAEGIKSEQRKRALLQGSRTEPTEA